MVVIVYADGTEEIVKSSMAVEDGVIVPLEEDATVKVIDNSKDFVDVPEDSTFAEAIDYMTSHELMNGVGDGARFDGNAPTTRAMVWTIIGRGEDAGLYGAGVFDRAGEWAIENGVSDGANPNGAVSRQQLAVMLWRAAGEPVSDQSLNSFNDSSNVADYAKMALAWVVENNIMQGNNGNLNPAGNATRNHVAAMYMRYMQTFAEV